MSDSTSDRDLRHPAGRASARFHELGVQLRTDASTVTDPRTRTLFATTAELLVTLEQAFADAE